MAMNTHYDLDFTINNSADADIVESLLQYRTADIHGFHLCLPESYDGPQLTYDVNSWIARIIQLKTRHVKIEMQHDETMTLFLDELFNHQKLESLELDLFMPDSLLGDEFGPIKIDSVVKLHNLRVLKLRIHGKVSGDSLGRVLPNCPVLEELKLYGWFDGLDIVSSSLKKVDLDVEDCLRLKISCPGLRYFDLHLGFCWSDKCVDFIADMPSLEKAVVTSHRKSRFVSRVVNCLRKGNGVQICVDNEEKL